jgi:hypothetical protein
MTSSSRMLIERMLHNSASVMLRQREEENIPDYPLFTHEEIERCAKRLVGLKFGHRQDFQVATRDEIEVMLHPAGHVAGAAAIEIRHKHRAIFFTGDVMFENQRTLPGAKFPTGHFDTLVMETTRGNTERHPDKSRGARMARLMTSINDTIQKRRLLPNPGLRPRPDAGDPLDHPRRPELPPPGRLPDLRLGARHGPGRLLRRYQPQDQAHAVQPRDRQGPEGEAPAPGAHAGEDPAAERALYHKLRHAGRADAKLHPGLGPPGARAQHHRICRLLRPRHPGRGAPRIEARRHLSFSRPPT